MLFIVALLRVFTVLAQDSGGTATYVKSSPESTPAESRAAASRCPDRVRDRLPEGGDTRLVAAFVTDGRQIVLCRAETGQLYYHGEILNVPNSAMVIPAQETDHGYMAHNGDYTYQISGDVVIIMRGAHVLSRMQLSVVTDIT